MTCRRAPSSASTLRTLDILKMTCRVSPSPASTLQTPEPAWRSWAAQLPPPLPVLLLVLLVVLLLVLLVILLVVVLLIIVVVLVVVGVDHHQRTGRPADAARPVSRGSFFSSK